MQYDNMIFIDGTWYRIQRAVINESSSGDQEIVAAVAGKRIYVVGYSLAVAEAVTLTWKSASDPITGPMPFTAGISESEARSGLFETDAGEALNLNLGTAVAIGGHLRYITY